MKRVLITGGTGFVGNHLVRAFLGHRFKVVVLDALTYATDLGTLPKEVDFIYHDLAEPIDVNMIRQIGDVSCVVHNAALSHVDRATADPLTCLRANVLGTQTMLDTALALRPTVFLYTSSDEVFGAVRDKPSYPSSRLTPSNIYSAGKAAGEHLVTAYRAAYGLNTIITRSPNLFGEWQHVEKLIPLTVRNILRGHIVEVHVSTDGMMGARSWFYAGVYAKAIVALCEYGAPGKYHVASGKHFTNLEIVEQIYQLIDQRLGPQRRKILEVVSPRASYDRAYSVAVPDDCKNWNVDDDFLANLTLTVNWYITKNQRGAQS